MQFKYIKNYPEDRLTPNFREKARNISDLVSSYNIRNSPSEMISGKSVLKYAAIYCSQECSPRVFRTRIENTLENT